MDLPCDARRGAAFSQLFSEAPLTLETPPAPPALERVKLICHRVMTETSLLLFVLVSSSLAMLLIIRPAFVLKFEQDQRRPWRGCTRLSWISVTTTLLLVSLLPFLLCFIWRRG